MVRASPSYVVGSLLEYGLCRCNHLLDDWYKLLPLTRRLALKALRKLINNVHYNRGGYVWR